MGSAEWHLRNWWVPHFGAEIYIFVARLIFFGGTLGSWRNSVFLELGTLGHLPRKSPLKQSVPRGKFCKTNCCFDVLTRKIPSFQDLVKYPTFLDQSWWNHVSHLCSSSNPSPFCDRIRSILLCSMCVYGFNRCEWSTTKFSYQVTRFSASSSSRPRASTSVCSFILLKALNAFFKNLKFLKIR